jgi:tRNA (cmo5U34)-methyltransferase
MSVDVKQIFDHAAADYDRLRRQLVPYFDDFYGTALECLPFAPDASFRVLDLGAGTGLFSALVADAFPNAHLTLVDISDEMLAKARARFASRPNVDYRTLNFEREPLSGEYNVAISALALHHVAPASLVEVFRSIYAVLVSGGMFVNADQTLGTTAANERKYAQAWRNSVKALGCADDDIHAALERMKADRTATLEDQLRWLRQAGFDHVDCWFKRYRFAVYSGTKP